jgi:hypothetical protein
MVKERNPRREFFFFFFEREGVRGIVGRDDAKTVLGGLTEE